MSGTSSKQLFPTAGGSQMAFPGSLFDSTGTLYQRYFNVVYQTSSTTAAVNTHYLCNTTSAAFTMTLPSGSAGAIVRFTDDAGTWATNNLTIAPAASQTIQGISSSGSLVCNLSGAWVELAWDATNSYWVVLANGFQYGPTYSPGVTGGILPSTGVPGQTPGSAITTGYTGEMLGTLRSGTNGFSYSTTSTTALTASPVNVLSATFNKGVYWVSYKIRVTQADGSSRNAYASLAIGGTNVQQNSVSCPLITNVEGCASYSIPIIVTADGTTVAVSAFIQSLSGSSSGNSHELTAMRIA